MKCHIMKLYVRFRVYRFRHIYKFFFIFVIAPNFLTYLHGYMIDVSLENRVILRVIIRFSAISTSIYLVKSFCMRLHFKLYSVTWIRKFKTYFCFLEFLDQKRKGSSELLASLRIFAFVFCKLTNTFISCKICFFQSLREGWMYYVTI